MLPVVRNIEIYQGDTFEIFFRLRVLNPDESPGAYIDLTGCTPKAQIRTAPGASGSPLAEFDASLGNQATYPGSVLLELDAADSAGLSVNGAWDCQLTLPSGKIRTYVAGTVTLIKEVTKP